MKASPQLQGTILGCIYTFIYIVNGKHTVGCGLSYGIAMARILRTPERNPEVTATNHFAKKSSLGARSKRTHEEYCLYFC